MIIVSACRTCADGDLRFVSSAQRLNVTLTRARHHLLLVGSASALLGDPTWASILGEAGSIPTHFVTGDGSGLEQAGVEQQRAEQARGDEADDEVGQDFEEAEAEEEALVDEVAEQEAAALAALVGAEAEEEDAAAERKAEAWAGAAAGGFQPAELLAAYPECELAQMLVAKQQQREGDEATKARVHEEMRARMDTGIRVNPALKRALLGEGGGGEGSDGAPGAALPGAALGSVDLLAAADSSDEDEDEEGADAAAEGALELLGM